MKKLAAPLLAGLFVFVTLEYLALAYPTIFPTGTTIYKPSQAYSSYILISDHSSVGNHPDATVRAEGTVPDDIRLIDMNGNVVHTWNVATTFNKRSRLAPNGHLLYAGPNRTIIEYDWDGNVVWTHEGIGSINDLRWLPNNNRLLIAHQLIPDEFQRQVKDVDISPWWAPRKRRAVSTTLRQPECAFSEASPRC